MKKNSNVLGRGLSAILGNSKKIDKDLGGTTPLNIIIKFPVKKINEEEDDETNSYFWNRKKSISTKRGI